MALRTAAMRWLGVSLKTQVPSGNDNQRGKLHREAAYSGLAALALSCARAAFFTLPESSAFFSALSALA